jgi:predicted ester cyclase
MIVSAIRSVDKIRRLQKEEIALSENNKTRVKQFFEEVVQTGNMALLDEFVAKDFVDHQPAPGQLPGVAGVRQFFTSVHAAISNLRVTIENMIAEGDLVAVHSSIAGKHTGEPMGIPPSGKDVVMRVSDIVRMENGKAVERWGVEDMSAFLPK